MAGYPHGNPSTDTRRQAIAGLVGALLTCLALATGVAQAATTSGAGTAFELHAETGLHMAEAGSDLTLVEEVALEEGYEDGDYELSVALHLLKSDGSDDGTLTIDGEEVTATGTVQPDDKGRISLPITFDAKGLEGRKLVALATLARDSMVIARSENLADGRQAVLLPKIGTTLSDQDGGMEAKGVPDVRLAAGLAWSNVDPSTGLRAVVTLVDADTGEPLLDDEGREVTASAPLPTDNKNKAAESGTTDVMVELDGTTHLGRRISVHAKLLLGSEVVASDSTATTANTVSLPRVSSSVTTDGTAIGLAEASAETSITTDISYEALMPGTTYLFTGELLDSKTGESLANDGGGPREGMTVTKELTPTEASGTTSLEYFFDARDLAGTTMVARVTLTRKVDGRELATTSDSIVALPYSSTEVVGGRSGIRCELADDEAVAKATISYTNLVPGIEYQARATAHLTGTDSCGNTTDEGVLHDVEGSDATGYVAFTPETEVGTIELAIPFDGTGREGRRIAISSDITCDDATVARNDDLSEESQALYLPKAATSCLGSAAGLDEVLAGSVSTIRATIDYYALPEGSYAAALLLVDPETGAQIDSVSARTTFEAAAKEGNVDLEWAFDTTGLKGRTFSATTYLVAGDAIFAADYGSTVLRIPSITASLHDAGTGSSMTLAHRETTLAGSVAFANVNPNADHVLRGRLIDAETGEELKDAEGKQVTGSATIARGASEGVATVNFKLDARNLAGRSVCAAFELVREDTTVALCDTTVDGADPVHLPLLEATVASKASGDHEFPAYTGQKATCTLNFANVIPDKTYRLRAALVDADTGEEIKVGSDPVQAEAEITPKEASGKVEVTLDCKDTTGLAGRTLAVVARMELDGRTVAVAEDRTNESQRLHVPSITTELHAKDGGHEIPAYKDQLLVDTITYANLTPGIEYTIEGELVDASTGKPALRATNQTTSQGSSQSSASTATGSGDTAKATDAFEGKPDATEVWVSDDSAYHLDKECESVNDTLRRTTLGIAKAAGKKPCDVESGAKAEASDKSKAATTATTPTTSGTSNSASKSEEVTVTAKATFTPTEPSGTAEVEFSLDATGLEGKRLVALQTVSRDGHMVVAHQDKGDAAQTVTVTEGGSAESMGQTGTGIGPFLAVAVGAALAALGFFLFRANKKDATEGSDRGHRG